VCVGRQRLNFGFSRSEERARRGVGFEAAPAHGAVLEPSGAAAEPAGEHTPPRLARHILRIVQT
jgi:hypothetical protein